MSGTNGKERIPLSTHLLAGGLAGMAEALAWYAFSQTPSSGGSQAISHPLDTIKVRMQLSKSRKLRGVSLASHKGLSWRLPFSGFTLANVFVQVSLGHHVSHHLSKENSGYS